MGGVEPPTFHFSGGRSYQLSYLPSPFPTSCGRDAETLRNSTGCSRTHEKRLATRNALAQPAQRAVREVAQLGRGGGRYDEERSVLRKGPLQLVEDAGERVIALHEQQTWGRQLQLGPRAGEVGDCRKVRGPRHVDGHRRPVSRRAREWASAARAAFMPAAPCTPPPGWAGADPR